MGDRKILLIGNGGHSKTVIDSILASNMYCKIGIVEKEYVEVSSDRITYVGTDDDLPLLYDKGWTDAFDSVGSVGDTRIRKRLYDSLKKYNFRIPSVIDSSSVVSENVVIGEGVYIGKRSVVNSGTIIENCAIINTGAIVEHDCFVGQFAHVSS